MYRTEGKERSQGFVDDQRELDFQVVRIGKCSYRTPVAQSSSQQQPSRSRHPFLIDGNWQVVDTHGSHGPSQLAWRLTTRW